MGASKISFGAQGVEISSGDVTMICTLICTLVPLFREVQFTKFADDAFMMPELLQCINFHRLLCVQVETVHLSEPYLEVVEKLHDAAVTFENIHLVFFLGVLRMSHLHDVDTTSKRSFLG